MTQDGHYYEAPFPLQPNHTEVERRPSEGEHFFHNGRWQPDRRHEYTLEEIYERYGIHHHQPHHHRPMEDYNMQGQEQPLSHQHQYDPSMPHSPHMPPPPVPGVNSPYTINQDSQFNFKLKDVVVIAGAIASAAVSWNNADGRISRLEEKVSQEMVKKIESIERKQDELVKKQEDSIKTLTSQISDLERAILNSNRNNGSK
jgi:hypothetical protein